MWKVRKESPYPECHRIRKESLNRYRTNPRKNPCQNHSDRCRKLRQVPLCRNHSDHCRKNHSDRYRENMLKIKSGDPLMVGGVIKSLMRRDCARGLSTGERRMLHYAKDILISEMTVSMELPSDDIENKLTLAVG